MGYRDDFYTVQNLIGYTGVLHRSPSVYFYNAGSSAYGHITQAHPEPANVGREEYVEDQNYLIENTDVYTNNYPVGEYAEDVGLQIAGQRCVEWQSGAGGVRESFHTSRNLFIPVQPSAFFPNAAIQNVALAVCAIVIREFPDIKPLYTA